MSDYNKIKLFSLGNASVGKTSYILKFTDDLYQDNTLTTTGIDLKSKVINYNEKEYKIEFYDTAGQERYRAISLNSIKSADGIVLMYDITNQKSFDEISNWMKNIKQLQGDDFPMILVGNKCDLENKRIVTYEEGMELSEKYKLPFFEVSNKNGINIEESSLALIKQIIEKKEAQIKELTKDYEVIEKIDKFELDRKTVISMDKLPKKKCC